MMIKHPIFQSLRRIQWAVGFDDEIWWLQSRGIVTGGLKLFETEEEAKDYARGKILTISAYQTNFRFI